MSRAQDKERIEADLRYWQALTRLIPEWELMGWTDRRSATFVTPGHYGPSYKDTLTMTGRQRDDLVAALAALDAEP